MASDFKAHGNGCHWSRPVTGPGPMDLALWFGPFTLVGDFDTLWPFPFQLGCQCQLLASGHSVCCCCEGGLLGRKQTVPEELETDPGGLSISFMSEAGNILVNFAVRHAYSVNGAVLMCAQWSASRGFDWILGNGPPCSPCVGNLYHIMLLSAEHWALFLLQLSGDDIVIAYFDGFVPETQLASPAVSAFCQLVKALCGRDYSLFFVQAISQTMPSSCGTVVLGHLAIALGLLDPTNAQCVEGLHAGLYTLSYWHNEGSNPCPWDEPEA